tara:strand:+ start:122 stop:1015 length:894 start_codon:yes stop_codon:yes gene_type:complete
MSNFIKNIHKEMAEVVRTTEERTKLLENLKSKGLKTQASIDKYVSNKKWLRDTIYANDVVAFGETELVYDPAKKVWNLDVATTDMFEGNPHAQAWFAKNYPGKDLSKIGKNELARRSLKYVPEFLNEVPPADTAIILKGSTISTQTSPKLGLKTTGAKKKGLYQKLWGHLPGFRSLPDGSLLFAKRALKIGGALGTLGVIGDAVEAKEGIQGALNPNASNLEQTADMLKGASGVLGMSSLKFPPALIPSLAAKGGELHMRNRIKKEKNRYKTLMDYPSPKGNLKIKQWDKHEGISTL